VIVRIFPPDLQEIICQVNKEFLEHALERKEEASIAKEPKKAIQSAFEDANGRANFQDLSIEALNKYRIKTNIPDVLEAQSFKRRLIQQGLLVETNGEYKPAGYSLLLFGNRPRDVFPQAGLLGTIRYPSGAEETRDFNNPLILIPALVEEWIKNKMPTILDRNQMVSEELLDSFPYIIIREAVVNALIHRDYDITGASVNLS
jgi:ATP-dependent DNA helicase RecG